MTAGYLSLPSPALPDWKKLIVPNVSYLEPRTMQYRRRSFPIEANRTGFFIFTLPSPRSFAPSHYVGLKGLQTFRIVPSPRAPYAEEGQDVSPAMIFCQNLKLFVFWRWTLIEVSKTVFAGGHYFMRPREFSSSAFRAESVILRNSAIALRSASELPVPLSCSILSRC